MGNTPLFGRHEEDADGHPGHRYNLNDSISYYIDAGVPREMIVVGMATFGHSWTLLDPSVNGLYCPTIGGTPPGPYTRQEGFLEYYEKEINVTQLIAVGENHSSKIHK